MRLELLWSEVTAVAPGAATRLAGGALEIDLAGLTALLEADPRLERVHIDLASPGEACRIGRVFDVYAPRAKDDGDGDFPGLLGPPVRAGRGRTRALGGVAVVVTDQQPDRSAALAVIDMSGPVAELTAFARTHNVVISASPAPGTGRSEYLAAIRQAGLRTAVHLAQAARGRSPTPSRSSTCPLRPECPRPSPTCPGSPTCSRSTRTSGRPASTRPSSMATRCAACCRP